MAKFDIESLGKNTKNIYKDINKVPILLDLPIEQRKKKETKTIRLDTELIETLETLAKHHNTNFTKILQYILYDYFDKNKIQ